MGLLERLREQRLQQITSHARSYLDADEDVVQWARAKNPDGRGDGFVFLTERHFIVHWRGRPEGPGAISLQDIESWGLDDDTSGGPLLGLDIGDDAMFVQLAVSTKNMAENATTFVNHFAQLTPDPKRDFTNGKHLGDFKTDGDVAVEGRPRPLSAHARRIAITVLGATLIVIGVVLVPLPGPWSFVINIAGLAILASEYDWAKDTLDWARDKYRAVSDKIKRTRRTST